MTVACEQTVSSTIVRPQSRNIFPQWEAKTVRFTVNRPGALRLEINGKTRSALLLFIDPPEESTPPPDAPKVVVECGTAIGYSGLWHEGIS